MTSRTLERVAGAAALTAMLATPFAPSQSRRRVALTWITVVGGAARTWAIERRRRGTSSATATVTAVVVGTWAAESWGARTGRLFGRYAYTERLRPLVGGVPLLVPFAWYAVAIPASTVAGRVFGTPSSTRSRVAIGALAMTAWDLFLDPQMTTEGYWRWASGGRYRGIPARNFVGWFAVAAGVMALLEATSGAGDDDAHVLTYGSLGVLETVAFSTFWHDPLVAAAGGLGMLPVTAAAFRP